MFSDARGGPGVGYRGQRHGSPDEDALLLPPGWAWGTLPGALGQPAQAAADPASVPWATSAGTEGYDKDGFQYARSWD
eukprot:SAG22_NODE_5489_length_1005_cov_1.002208_2_plen_77_part_01